MKFNNPFLAIIRHVAIVAVDSIVTHCVDALGSSVGSLILQRKQF